MLTNADFKDLLKLFESYDIRYLVVGGYAVMKYSEPRFTKDLDLWIATDPQNAASVYKALKDFGAPLADLSPEDFTEPGYFYQMGRAPLRIDIMMSIPGIDFESAWHNREIVELDDIRIPFISKSDLIVAKKAGGRPQDDIDLKKLEDSDLFDEKTRD
ncbi:MAG: nucleotidyltransferase [Deltaproteobacteria bacterium]|nr:nucleotidyltransferase [Deltaproteobacteria bacterium]